ncbi:MAG: cell envelope integrity protein CreD [Chitinophagales bacterium]
MSENPSNLERIGSWVRQSLTLKLLSIGFLILILLIPTMMIDSLIREREYRRNDTVREISNTWGNSQTIAGPVLTVPYKHYTIIEDTEKKTTKTVSITKYAHFLPNELVIKSNISPEIRYRGIYEAILYNAQLQLNGNFSSPNFDVLGIDPQNALWSEAFVSIGIPDMRGIQESIELKWDSGQYMFDPGIPVNEVFGSGVSVGIPLQDTVEVNIPHIFSLNININGSESLSFMPLGKETTLAMQSNWGSPSFNGAFLPDERNITKDGFTANWKVLHLNRNYPQQWLGNSHDIAQSQFGLSLLRPLDEYQKNERSVKYAIMFICLTFLLFFFVEILNSTRIHPLQYLLVGLSICVFYLLLLSFSEQIGFNKAYMIASTGVILLITIYSKSVLKNNFLTIVMFGTLVGLYGFLYSLLQLQDYALLMGSVGLFVILAVVMYLSRNIDWYTIGKRQK